MSTRADHTDIFSQQAGAGTPPDSTRPHPDRPAAKTSYHRTVHHITQEPIVDESYRRAAEPRGNRKHMGVATSDPQYLTEVHPGAAPSHPKPANRGAHAVGSERMTPNYSRYLETPKSTKPIFTSRQQIARRRAQRFLVLLIVLAVILALVWFFLLR